MKLGTNPKKVFLYPKSNFTICEKNLQQLRLFLKSYDSFLIFLIFRFLGVLPISDLCRNMLIETTIYFTGTKKRSLITGGQWLEAHPEI